MINRKKHQCSIRLKAYDYSQNGLYFITICIHHNINLLDEVIDGKMVLSCIGEMIEKQWLDLSDHFEGIKTGEFVLMPNHFHGVIELLSHLSGQPQGIAPTGGCEMINRKNHRRSIRLNGYDYSQNGLYFITICIHHNINLLGEVIDGKMVLSCIGEMIEKQWLDLSDRFEGIKIGEFVLMPNHFHGVIELLGHHSGQPEGTESGQPQGIAPTGGCCRGNPLWLPFPSAF